MRINHERDLVQLPLCDVIVLSADSLGVTELVNSYAIKTKTALIPVGYMGDLAVVGPFYVPSQTACLVCRRSGDSFNFDLEVKELANQINSNFQSPFFGPLNLMAVSFASYEVLKYLFDQSVLSANKKIGISLDDLILRSINCEPNEGCIFHEN